MKYSLLALTALLLPPQAMMVQACDTTAQGILFLEPESATFCHPYPGCTSWTAKDTIAIADTIKAKARAQKADSGDVLVGDYDLTNIGEFVRLELKKGEVYRVECASRSGMLQIRPRRNWDQAALPLTIEDIPRASGTRALEIVPRQDGEYEFRATSLSGFGMRLRVFREGTPSRRWLRLSGNRA
jgi:hypothetical protein